MHRILWMLCQACLDLVWRRWCRKLSMYKQRTSTCSTCSLRAPAALVNFLRRDARTVPGQLSLKDAASSSSALAPTQPINIEFHSLRPWHLRELLDSLHLHLIVLSQLQLQSQPMKIYRYLGLSPTVFFFEGDIYTSNCPSGAIISCSDKNDWAVGATSWPSSCWCCKTRKTYLKNLGRTAYFLQYTLKNR